MKKLLLTLVLTLFTVLTYAQTIGIIGSFNNWSGDINMSSNDNVNWTLSHTFTANAELKFRQDASWNMNWGNGAFPSGIAIQNGNNIPVPAGTYTISFNSSTGAYNFQSPAPIVTYDVTFSVDMSQYTGSTTAGVFVNGTFNSWCGSCNPLTDMGNGIWQVTIPLTAANLEYKFTIGGWDAQENLISGSSCTVTNFGYTNRSYTVATNAVLPTVCWNSCSSCQSAPSTYNTTFSVDMSQYTGSTANGVFVNGTFNGWCGTCNPMTDMGSGIWQTTLPLPAGSIEYKFTVDGWNAQENLVSGSSCTVTNSGYTNRSYAVSAVSTIPTVCWNSCSSCQSAPSTYNTTFSLDMSQYTGSTANGVFVNGTFNGWCGTCNPMTDTGNGIFEVSLPLPAGAIEYKFTVDGWNVVEQFVGGETCTITTGGFTNRGYTISGNSTIPEVCWSSCQDCPTVVPCPTITPSFTQVAAICTGVSLSALPTTSNNGIDGTWSPALDNTATTTYTFTPAAGACASTATMQIEVNAIPTITASAASATVCSGSSVVLTATGASTYAWDNGSTGSTITVSPTAATTYTVTGTSAAGCTATATVSVGVISAPVVTAPSTVVCSGAAVVLTSSLTSGVQWYKTGVLISGATSATYSATTAGTYTVKPTACSSLVSNGIVITTGTNPGTPTASVQSGTLLLCGTGAQVVLASNIVPSTSATLQWYKDGAAITGATSTTYTATTGGSYLVRRIGVANGCYSISNTQVAVSGGPLPPAPTANVQSGDLLLCGSGAQVTLQSTIPPSASSTLQWFKNGISISGATAQTYVANSAGAYTVKRVYVSSGCASSSNSVSVVQGGSLPSAPSISSPTSVICSGAGTITMTSNQAPSATVSLQWYKNGVLVSGATAQTYAAVSVGSYTVKKLSTTGGCASLPSNAIGVSVGVTPSTIPAISIQTGTLPLCTGSAVVLQTSAIPTSNQTLQWYKSGVALPGATGTSYTAIVGGSYKVKLVETGGCATTSSTFSVSQQSLPSTPTISVHSGSLTLCNGSSVTLKSSSAPSATAGIRWYKDGVQIMGATSQFYTTTTQGVYTARRITLSSGCLSNASGALTVISCNPIVVNDNNEEQEDATSKLNEELVWDAAVSRNPYDQYVTIRLNTASDSDVELTMIDAMGKVVSHDVSNLKELGSMRIGEGLTPGMYLIQVRQDENIKTIRVIKQ